MLRPQDVLCVLKISCLAGREWGLRDLGKAVGLSSGESYNAFSRLKASGLVYEVKAGEVKVASRRLHNFLVHGVPTVYYSERGQIVRGMVTGSSAPPLSTLAEGDVPLVWPCTMGKARGETLQPIYESAPAAAAADPRLYELLVLLDCLRTGRTKERKLASDLLEQRLGVPTATQEAA